MRFLSADPSLRAAGAPERKRTRAALRRPRSRARLVAAAVVATGLLAGAGWTVHRGGWDAWAISTLEGRALALSGEIGLAVQDVTVRGRAHVTPESILEALDVRRGTPIFAVSPLEAKARLEAIPWVRTASVERMLPGTLYVRITERQPLALWQRNGKLELVDGEGKVLPVKSLDEFGSLLVLVGDDAPKEGAALLEMLASEPRLRPRVTAAVWVGGRRWNLHFDTGVDVELPEGNPTAAWHELARLDRTDGLLKREIRRVDFRLPDRVVLQGLPDPAKPAAKKKSPGRST